ncbi:hypothetical protein HDU83_001073 [Entophlyctis luteolus]|nr:hypothetical protein HDU83_001073 [Entophlyctis luteolus]
MPLLNNAPVPLTPLPDLPEAAAVASADAADPHETYVWVIAFTGEIFSNYEIFSCATTGKGRLTYMEALRSERAASEKAQNRFPVMWRKPALEFIHFNRCMMVALIDKLYEFLKERLFVDEVVTTPTKGCRATHVKVMSIINNSKSTEPHVDDEIPPSDLSYIVHLCDENGVTVKDSNSGELQFEVRANQCRRPRSVFNKANIKWFIKESADRGPSNFSHWLVKDSLVKKYGLPTEIPPSKRFKPTSSKPNPEDLIEDLELAKFVPANFLPSRPVACTDFCGIPPNEVTQLIQTWNFLTVFGKPLNLPSATLDEYVRSIISPRVTTFLHEALMALLHQAAQLRLAQIISSWHSSTGNPNTHSGSGAANSGAARLFGVALTSAINSASAQTSVPPSNPADTAAYDRFMGLSAAARAGVDAWCRSASSVNAAARAAAARWEVALVGFVRDCMAETEGKWRLLGLLIPDIATLEASGDGHGAVDAVDDDYELAGSAMGADENGGTDIAAPGRKRAMNGNGNGHLKWNGSSSPLAWHGEGEDDGLADQRRSSRRKRRKVDSYYSPTGNGNGTPNDEYVDAFTVEDEDDEGEEFRNSEEIHVMSKRTTRSSRFHSKDGHGIMATRSTRATAAAAAAAVAASTATSIQSEKTKDDTNTAADTSESGKVTAIELLSDTGRASVDEPTPALPDATTGNSWSTKKPKQDPKEIAVEVDRLATLVHRGFVSLSATDRLLLLQIICERWVGQSNTIRAYAEAMHDKLADIKKFKRESQGKEQRAVAIARYEYEEKVKASQSLGSQANDMDLEDAALPDDESKANMEDDSDDSESVHLSASAIRMRKIRREHARKKERERLQRELSNRAKMEKRERDKEHKALVEELKSVQLLEQNFYQKLVNHEVEHVMALSVSRMAPIGTDRNHSKYWWFDTFHGLIQSKSMPAAVDYLAMCPFRDFGYSAGVLLVESCDSLDGTLSTWGYYKTVEEVDQLTASLDPRGVREYELLEGLRKVKEAMDSAMTKRVQALSARGVSDPVLGARKATGGHGSRKSMT